MTYFRNVHCESEPIHLPPPIPRKPLSLAKKPQDVSTSFQCNLPVSGGAIFKNGNIALTSFDNGKVVIINSTGDNLKEFNIPKPWDAAVRNDRNKELLFISFLKTAEKPARIDFIEWTVDHFPKTFTRDVITPYGLAFTLQNELCVCEKKSHEVRIFDVHGKMIRRICQPQFECPWYIAVTNDGKTLISDFEARCVWCLNEKGYIIDKLDKASESDPTEFHPAKCVSDGKDFFISDQDGGKVRVLSKTGQVRTVIARKNTKEEIFCPVVLLVQKQCLIVVSKHGEVIKMPVPSEDEKFRWLK
ncbi:uncharacterized protein LOC134231810 [Saccostrea cucullata]|uniref:uncharacterized protein LOC134231810 n=1 Tax=Saccostrea cuccullata TaxID=36930 RepID=UPI002ED050FF